ncbi:MAG: heavy-metal-associated domain-containing protein [Gammaproteobacteria bacterium]|nr:heavy-metal-associated domain-containing protein [Gammaproteobacteria bacterium]
MERLELTVDGMQCEGCVASVQNALTGRDGVTVATARLHDGLVTVEFDPAAIDRVGIETTIEEAGFEVVPG